jgi:hypothetical protein
MVEKDDPGGGEECDLHLPTGRLALDERAALIFWAALLSLFASVTGAVAASALHVDPTQIEAGLVGAFLGSSPVIFLPALSGLIVGRNNAFIDRARLPFRLLTLCWGCLVVCSRLLHWWPRHSPHTSAGIAIGGLVAAILASWFWPHLPAAARLWARQQLPSARAR